MKENSLKQKIGNIIQCRIDIAEQDKEIAIRNELMVLKRELLETFDEVTKQIQKITGDVHKNLDSRILDLDSPERAFIHGVINALGKEVLAVLEGEK